MVNKASLYYQTLFFLFSVIISSCSIAPAQGKKQSEALQHLYKAKWMKNSPVDTTHFRPIRHVHGDHDQGLKERDRIERLPGQPDDVQFAQYGGYVTVNETAGRAFYYYFVEADQQQQQHYSNYNHSLPLLLWLNGGPGCSSLAYGAMQELGPFRVHSDGKTLYKNRFSWNHAANVLFLESPAGVGFSYSNTTSDIVSGGDRKTALDNYVFLLNWLERFPEYKSRDLYISGESYAGHYVPQLAHTILHNNNEANTTLVNLKGILIGNAAINDKTDTIGSYYYFASHALISDETWYRIQKYCDFSVKNQSDNCNNATGDADNNLKDIDIYNIYGPLCYSSNLTAKPKETSAINFDPCEDNYVHAYLNRPDVQEALHANVTRLGYEWESCSEVIKQWEDSPSTMIPLLQEFVANGLRVWVYSGDTDAMVPVTSTKYSILKMNLPVKTAWHPWFLDGEVGGYTQVYKGDLTLATVRGAGHEVPSYQPPRALSLIMHFLAGTPLPNSSRQD